MRRVLFTIVSGVSLVALAGVCALWVRSHWYADSWSQTDAQGRTRIVQSQVGVVHLRQIENNAGILGMPTMPTWSHHTVAPGTTWGTPYAALSQKIEWRAAGFGIVSGNTGMTTPLVLGNANSGIVTLNNINGTITSTATNITTLNPAAATDPGVVFNPGGGIRITGSGSTVSGLTVSGGNVSMNPGATITANTITFYTGPQAHLAVVIPYWCPAAVSAILPVVFAFKSRKWLRERRRRRLGLCRCCGYDLRASSGRCPECGTEM